MNQEQKINPLFCDPATGVCEIPGAAEASGETNFFPGKKPVQILYFTDPICSTCWGIEPQLRKLELEYGGYFEIAYRMGGLLPAWDVYGGKDVSGPASVAPHWEEVSSHYDMPIDGDVWLEDPLASSFPPSIAFKAAQLQGQTKALRFLRKIKEMVFLHKKNITKWEHLHQAALESGLDPEKLKQDYAGQGRELFEEDLKAARALGVRGFPSIFFSGAENNPSLVYGYRPYEQYEQALLKLFPQAIKKAVDTSPEALFAYFPTLTTREFAVLANTSSQEAEKLLNRLHDQGLLGKFVIKNGTLWSK
ncbi:MAG: DsbA family protein [Adhaeribacter sp.]